MKDREMMLKGLDNQQGSSSPSIPPWRGKWWEIIFDRITEGNEKTSVNIIELMKSEPEITAMKILKLQQQGNIKRIGPAKGGHWEVIDDGK